MRVRTTHKSGYLLLEAVLALTIFAIVFTAIFQIVNWNLKVTQTSIDSSNKAMKEAAFFSFLDRAFNEMSGDAIVNLTTSETTHYYLSELTIQNSSAPFSWPGSTFTAKAVKIVTRENSSRRLDIDIEYYTDNLLTSPFNRNSSEVVDPDQEPIQTLTILNDINMFEWRVWDGLRTIEDGNPNWVYEWENSGQVPRYFELKTIFQLEPGQDYQREQVVHTFWNPRKVNPSTHFQALQRQANQSSNPSEAPTTPR